MRTALSLIIALFLFMAVGRSQETSAKNTTNKSAEQGTPMAKLLADGTFEFVALTAYPLGQSPVDLSTEGYSVTFAPELLQSHLPFYGRGYAGAAMRRDTGLRFSGKPESYNYGQTAHGHEVNLQVQAKNDTYTLSLSVQESGRATLTVSGNDRSNSTFHGEVRALKPRAKAH